MDILVIGVSSVFRNRVLPALLELNCIDRIHLASRRVSTDVVIPQAKRGTFTSGYEAALRSVPPCLAYVSLPNHLHGEFVEKALLADFHVIVDKPAFLSLGEAEAMLGLAAERKRCLAEATVWPFQPQVAVAREAFLNADSEPRSIQAAFSFPPLPRDNFRNNPAMGGGSFHDLRAYAVSTGRVFFQSDPVEVWCRNLELDTGEGIDAGFALSAIYPHGRVFQGFFSFGTEYQNRVSLLGPRLSVVIDPAFTLPAKHCPILTVRASNAGSTISAPAGDGFKEFLGEVMRSIGSGAWFQWADILRQDAVLSHRAALSAAEGSKS